MNTDILKRLVSQMDEEDAVKILDEVDIPKFLDELAPYIDKQVNPHLEEVRDGAQETDYESIRDLFSEMSEQKQQEKFDTAVSDLIAVIRECRERPSTGFKKLKGRLRDPYTVESLLLIFQNEDHIDPEYSEDIKEFARMTIKWSGMSAIPEAYTQEEMEAFERDLQGE